MLQQVQCWVASDVFNDRSKGSKGVPNWKQRTTTYFASSPLSAPSLSLLLVVEGLKIMTFTTQRKLGFCFFHVQLTGAADMQLAFGGSSLMK